MGLYTNSGAKQAVVYNILIGYYILSINNTCFLSILRKHAYSFSKHTYSLIYNYFFFIISTMTCLRTLRFLDKGDKGRACAPRSLLTGAIGEEAPFHQ